jgi:hypothetical protein
MCWNKDVSLNTFLFSSFVFLLILYNNKYSIYKIKEFENIWFCLFIISVFSIQLVEYFLWIYLNNKYYNYILTFIIFLLLAFFQPISAIMLIPYKRIKYITLGTYLLLLFILIIINKKDDVKSIKNKNGHLNWMFTIYNYKLIFYCLFIFFSLFLYKYYVGLFFSISLLLICLYNYYNDLSFSSMWCWMINITAIYYIYYLLFYLPFKK